MKRLFVLWFVLASSLPALAAPSPDELLCGCTKGYARHANTSPNRKRVEFHDSNKKTILTITGAAAQKWSKWETILGPCYASQPKLTIKNSRGKTATVYRFRGGIIVAYDGKSFALEWPSVMVWEIAGGSKGPLGLPTTDNVHFKIARPAKQRTL